MEGEFYKMLRTIMEQTTENNFQQSLDGLLGRLASGLKTKDFHKYFLKEWVPKKTQWAYCYRVDSRSTPTCSLRHSTGYSKGYTLEADTSTQQARGHLLS